MNCLHVLDELRPLEEKWEQELVVIGVHSPKFEFEKDPEALAANIERYEVTHPVIDDPELETWSAYGARAWPTLMVLDTHGRIAGNLSGEGMPRTSTSSSSSWSPRERPTARCVAARPPPCSPSAPPDPPLPLEALGPAGRAPGGLRCRQHRLVVFQNDGTTVDAIIGTGTRGHADGDAEIAQFAEPNGVLALLTRSPPRSAMTC